MKEKEFTLSFHTGTAQIKLPAAVDSLGMSGTAALVDPAAAISDALKNPVGSPPLRAIVREKKQQNTRPKAVVVISDNTRPVPYKGDAGILMPIIRLLLQEGIPADDITVLAATGTHRLLSRRELEYMLDPEVFTLGVAVVNHDCRDTGSLVSLGRTSRGTDIQINSRYMAADIKILTGLVESHFMAGASGGRKSICPGLIGETGTYVFHGPEMMADPLSTDLVLEGNPCHAEALEVARTAGADFIVNVTLTSDFSVAGVFAGAMEAAHEAAVEQVRRHVGVSFSEPYDVVITHAGYVGINHYQAAKAGTAALRAVRPGGFVIMAADTVDSGGPVGALTYRTALQLLKLSGPEKFLQLIKSPDWVFIPEQWQVQMWGKLFAKIPMDHLYFYAPQFTADHYDVVPGINGARFVHDAEMGIGIGIGIGMGMGSAVQQFYTGALTDAATRLGKPLDEISVCLLLDGPYGVPLQQQKKQQ